MKKKTKKFINCISVPIFLALVISLVIFGGYYYYCNCTWEDNTVYGNLENVSFLHFPHNDKDGFILALDTGNISCEKNSPSENYNWEYLKNNYVRVDYKENPNGYKILYDVTIWK